MEAQGYVFEVELAVDDTAVLSENEEDLLRMDASQELLELELQATPTKGSQQLQTQGLDTLVQHYEEQIHTAQQHIQLLQRQLADQEQQKVMLQADYQFQMSLLQQQLGAVHTQAQDTKNLCQTLEADALQSQEYLSILTSNLQRVFDSFTDQPPSQNDLQTVVGQLVQQANGIAHSMGQHYSDINVITTRQIQLVQLCIDGNFAAQIPAASPGATQKLDAEISRLEASEKQLSKELDESKECFKLLAKEVASLHADCAHAIHQLTDSTQQLEDARQQFEESLHLLQSQAAAADADYAAKLQKGLACITAHLEAVHACERELHQLVAADPALLGGRELATEVTPQEQQSSTSPASAEHENSRPPVNKLAQVVETHEHTVYYHDHLANSDDSKRVEVDSSNLNDAVSVLQVQQQVEKVQAQNASLRQDLQAAQDTVQQLECKLQAVAMFQERSVKELVVASDSVSVLEANLAQAVKEKATMTSRLQELQQQCAGLQAQLDREQEACKSVVHESEELHSMLSELMERHEQLQRLYEAAKAESWDAVDLTNMLPQGSHVQALLLEWLHSNPGKSSLAALTAMVTHLTTQHVDVPNLTLKPIPGSVGKVDATSSHHGEEQLLPDTLIQLENLQPASSDNESELSVVSHIIASASTGKQTQDGQHLLQSEYGTVGDKYASQLDVVGLKQQHHEYRQQVQRQPQELQQQRQEPMFVLQQPHVLPKQGLTANEEFQPAHENYADLLAQAASVGRIMHSSNLQPQDVTSHVLQQKASHGVSRPTEFPQAQSVLQQPVQLKHTTAQLEKLQHEHQEVLVQHLELLHSASAAAELAEEQQQDAAQQLTVLKAQGYEWQQQVDVAVEPGSIDVDAPSSHAAELRMQLSKLQFQLEQLELECLALREEAKQLGAAAEDAAAEKVVLQTQLHELTQEHQQVLQAGTGAVKQLTASADQLHTGVPVFPANEVTCAQLLQSFSKSCEARERLAAYAWQHPATTAGDAVGAVISELLQQQQHLQAQLTAVQRLLAQKPKLRRPTSETGMATPPVPVVCDDMLRTGTHNPLFDSSDSLQTEPSNHLGVANLQLESTDIVSAHYFNRNPPYRTTSALSTGSFDMPVPPATAQTDSCDLYQSYLQPQDPNLELTQPLEAQELPLLPVVGAGPSDVQLQLKLDVSTVEIANITSVDAVAITPSAHQQLQHLEHAYISLLAKCAVQAAVNAVQEKQLRSLQDDNDAANVAITSLTATKAWMSEELKALHKDLDAAHADIQALQQQTAGRRSRARRSTSGDGSHQRALDSLPEASPPALQHSNLPPPVAGASPPSWEQQPLQVAVMQPGPVGQPTHPAVTAPSPAVLSSEPRYEPAPLMTSTWIPEQAELTSMALEGELLKAKLVKAEAVIGALSDQLSNAVMQAALAEMQLDACGTSQHIQLAPSVEMQPDTGSTTPGQPAGPKTAASAGSSQYPAHLPWDMDLLRAAYHESLHIHSILRDDAYELNKQLWDRYSQKIDMIVRLERKLATEQATKIADPNKQMQLVLDAKEAQISQLQLELASCRQDLQQVHNKLLQKYVQLEEQHRQLVGIADDLQLFEGVVLRMERVTASVKQQFG